MKVILVLVALVSILSILYTREEAGQPKKESNVAHGSGQYSKSEVLTKPTNPELLTIEPSSADIREIQQDVNLRTEPGLSGAIIRPLIKGELVNVKGQKDIIGKTWYNIDSNGAEGWISYLGFIADPSKASAANCDPINGHVDSNGYCVCNAMYSWDQTQQKCASQEVSQASQSVTFPTYQTPHYYSPTYAPTSGWGEGHQAGYDWAERREIENTDDCTGNSNSFIEGCIEYVNDVYDGCNEGEDCSDRDSYDDCDESEYCSNNL